MNCKYCSEEGFSDVKRLDIHRRRNKDCYNKWKIEQEEIKNSKTYVICKICGVKLRNISNTHLKRKHNITQKQYKEMFPGEHLFADGLLDVQRERREKSIVNKYGSQSIKSNTLENYQRKYGFFEGLEKYKVRNLKCSHSLENYQIKYGKEGGLIRYEKLKQSRKGRNTLQWYINRYGKEKGEDRYRHFCSKMSECRTLKAYIKRYGIEEGTIIWKKLCKKRAHTLDSYQKRLGNELGLLKYQEHLDRLNCFKQSKKALDLFKILNRSINEKIYYYDNPKEYGIYLHKPKTYIMLDFYIPSKKKVIEFFGNYWHCNPKMYKETDTVVYPDKQLKIVKDIWDNDKIRVEALLDEHKIETMIVWEDEWDTNSELVVSKCLLFLNK